MNRQKACLHPTKLDWQAWNQFKAWLFDRGSVSLPEPKCPQQSLKHSTAHLPQCTPGKCSSSSWSSRPTRVYILLWHCSLLNYLPGWEALPGKQYQSSHFIKKQVHFDCWSSLTKLELLPNGQGACTEIPGIPVLGTTCKNVQAVAVWSQLLHETAAICFQWWAHPESNTAFLMNHCTCLTLLLS